MSLLPEVADPEVYELHDWPPFPWAVSRSTLRFPSELNMYQFAEFNQHSAHRFGPTSSDRQVLQDPIDIPRPVWVQGSAHCEIRFLLECRLSNAAAYDDRHVTVIWPDFFHRPIALIWSNIGRRGCPHLWIILQLLTVYRLPTLVIWFRQW